MLLFNALRPGVDMNPAIFMKIFGEVDISKLFLNIDQNGDELEIGRAHV